MVVTRNGICNVCGAPCRYDRCLCATCKQWYGLCRAAMNFARRVREDVRAIHKRARRAGVA